MYRSGNCLTFLTEIRRHSSLLGLISTSASASVVASGGDDQWQAELGRLDQWAGGKRRALSRTPGCLAARDFGLRKNRTWTLSAWEIEPRRSLQYELARGEANGNLERLAEYILH